MPGPVSAAFRVYVGFLLAGLVAAGGAAVLFGVGGPLGLLALFALVVVLFAGLGVVLRLA